MVTITDKTLTEITNDIHDVLRHALGEFIEASVIERWLLDELFQQYGIDVNY